VIIKFKSDLGCQTLKATQFVVREISKKVIGYHDLTMRQAGRLNPPLYKWEETKSSRPSLSPLPRVLCKRAGSAQSLIRQRMARGEVVLCSAAVARPDLDLQANLDHHLRESVLQLRYDPLHARWTVA
jgi:hypothetical protein